MWLSNVFPLWENYPSGDLEGIGKYRDMITFLGLSFEDIMNWIASRRNNLSKAKVSVELVLFHARL